SVAAVSGAGVAEVAAPEHAAEHVVEVRTGERGTLPAATRTEHSAEDILEPVGPAAARGEAGGAGAEGTQLVVLGPLLRVGEHRVRFADLFESGLGRLVT